MLSHDALSLDSVMLDEAKAYLRIESDEEDAPLGAIILAAIGYAETFTRQLLIRREVTETMPTTSQWRRLMAMPVKEITSATGLPADGASFALPRANYTADIDNNGDAHFRVMQPGAAGRVEVRYQAGMVPAWADLPEALRLGILRLTAHFHLHRDAPDDAGPPAAVAALLTPYRRMQLS
jgi:uncharacterized phiE125 gp8 family phage protein